MLRRALKTYLVDSQFELHASLTHWRGVLKSLRYHGQKHLKLQLACGDNYKPGWINVDLTSRVADVLLDLRRQLPFDSESASEVYSEHFLEHLSFPYDTDNFLKEVWRVLEPGGKLTIVVPDSVWPMKAYFEGYDADYFKTAKKKKWHEDGYSTRMEHVNFHFRQYGQHQYAYDEEILAKVLGKHGFVKMKRRKFNPKVDNVFHHPGSLYMVCYKP